MSSISMDKKDEIVMKLVHFLVTKENYTPIVVNGVRNEVWLENVEGPYKIIRINSNYIHNKEFKHIKSLISFIFMSFIDIGNKVTFSVSKK